MREFLFNYHFETASGAHPSYCKKGTGGKTAIEGR
jgi:hypothetical protein